jgi:hypothetical protein
VTGGIRPAGLRVGFCTSVRDGNTCIRLQSLDAENIEDIQQHWIGELDESYIVREEALS